MFKNNKKLKIAVAMSGGVDSSVAAKLLKDQGHEVVGFFLHFWQEESNSWPRPLKGKTRGRFENKCCSTQALLDARRVADKIGIPLYTLNFAKIFKEKVADNFLAEYAGGRTPNPCVSCNKSVKLGFLIKQIRKLGFDYLASGHYARLRREVPNSPDQPASPAGGFANHAKKKLIYKLYKAKDKNKDQSYFLYTFNQTELARLLFPLSHYTKTQVRQMAKKFKLPVAEKPESQGICFIPEKSHNQFLKRHLKLKPGLIKTLDNKIIGAHQGLPLYTIGQRKGIEIGGIGPFYAVQMDYKTNTLFVVNNRCDQSIFKNILTAKKINWLTGAPPASFKCQAVIRYRHRAAECAITKINKNNFKVKFLEPQRAITPGQSVVFYQGEEVLGGGIIK